jgi:hypothetical protein
MQVLQAVGFHDSDSQKARATARLRHGPLNRRFQLRHDHGPQGGACEDGYLIGFFAGLAVGN